MSKSRHKGCAYANLDGTSYCELGSSRFLTVEFHRFCRKSRSPIDSDDFLTEFPSMKTRDMAHLMSLRSTLGDLSRALPCRLQNPSHQTSRQAPEEPADHQSVIQLAQIHKLSKYARNLHREPKPHAPRVNQRLTHSCTAEQTTFFGAASSLPGNKIKDWFSRTRFRESNTC